MHRFGVYIHIPFCASKCNYCDFLSFPGMDFEYGRYVEALINEVRNSSLLNVSTVYIGGGTPTVLPIPLMKDILECVMDLPLSDNTEISIEVNPGTVTSDYLVELKSSGVNRLSFGLQSTHNRLLKSIGRMHSYEHFFDNYTAAKEVGFNNINIDLMFGLPGQTMNDFEETLQTIVSLEPQHLSFYSLTPCEDTPLWNQLSLCELIMPADEDDRSMYHLVSSYLTSQGYRHYEISNAAKPGYECVHNIDCWKLNPYVGFGLGAHSFDGRRRFANPTNLKDYFDSIKPDKQSLSRQELISEAMILGLRLLDGINESEFESKFGVIPSVHYASQINALVKNGLLKNNSGRIHLSSLGLDLANQVFMQFLQDT